MKEIVANDSEMKLSIKEIKDWLLISISKAHDGSVYGKYKKQDDYFVGKEAAFKETLEFIEKTASVELHGNT